MANNCINRRRGQEGWEELEDYEEERGQEDDHQEGQEFTDASAAGPPEGPEEEGEAGARSAGRRSERCGRRRPGFYPPPLRVLPLYCGRAFRSPRSLSFGPRFALPSSLRRPAGPKFSRMSYLIDQGVEEVKRLARTSTHGHIPPEGQG